MNSKRDRPQAPSRIILYGDPSSPALDLTQVQDHLSSLVQSRVEVKGEFFTPARSPGRESLAREMAKARVRTVSSRDPDFEPLFGEVEYERRILLEPERRHLGVAYDGVVLATMASSLLDPSERFRDVLHIIFTQRLLATFDDFDRRYHARTSVFFHPNLLSTSGLVEAPAKPKEYYLARRAMPEQSLPLATELMKEELRNRFLDYDDPRTTDVMKGYATQALFYHLTHEPFCENPDCCLFNSHWQEEVLRAQRPGALCPLHRESLTRLLSSGIGLSDAPL